MNKTRLPLLIAISLLAIFLAGCGGAVVASSWPGVTAQDDLAYLTDGTQVLAVRTADRSLAWRYPEKPDQKKGLYAQPVLSPDGQLLVPGFDHLLYSLNPQNGQVNWTFSGAKDRLIGSPLATADAIYQPSADHHLYALDLQGNLRWAFETEQAVWAAPALHEGALYLTSLDHFLYAIDPQNGQQLWKADLGGAVTSTPAVGSDGQLFISSVGKEVLAVDSANGSILWRAATAGGVWSTPVLLENSLLVGDSTGKLYSLDIANGSERWSQQVNGAIVGQPLVASDAIVLGTDRGELLAFTPAGQPLWNQTVNGKLYQGPVLAGEQILLAPKDADERLIAVAPASGTQAWSFVLE